MIKTSIESKVQIQDVITNQVPSFILDENPKFVDFLKQYYISQEYQGGPVDLTENLDEYLKLDNLKPEVIVDSSTTVGITTVGAETINVTSTKGFPSEYGLLKIGNEIITYTGITTNSLLDAFVVLVVLQIIIKNLIKKNLYLKLHLHLLTQVEIK